MAYLYEVGSGKTYSTISSALDQVYTDWGSTPFDGTVEVRVYDGTYNETILPNTGLKPQADFPLALRAAAGNSPVISRTGLGTDVFQFATNKPTILDGFTFSGVGTAQDLGQMSHSVVRNCTFETGVTYGYWIFGPSRSLFEDCSFTKAGSDGGYFLRGASGCLFRRCRFDWSARSITRVEYAATTPIHFEACEFIGDGSGYIYRTAHGSTTGWGNLMRFVNNSCLNFQGLMEPEDLSIAIMAFQITNNIFRTMAQPVIDLTNGPSDRVGYMVEANCFSDCPSGFVKDQDGTYSGLAALQAAGYDTLQKSITDDPLFTSEVGGSEDLSLQAGSPCINAGVGAGVLRDVDGNECPYPYKPAIGADFQHDVVPSVPDAPGITAASVSGTTVTATVDGDDGVTNYVQLRRASTGSIEDEQSRSGDGDVDLDAPETGSAYALVPYSQSGDYRSKPGAPWPVYVSGGVTAGEIVSAVVSRLASASEVTVRLASADAIYRRRPPRAAGFPCITYELAMTPDVDATELGKLAGELMLDLWGFDRDLLDELVEAVDDALALERISTDHWEIKRLARTAAEPAGSELTFPSTGRALERIATRWELRAYRKGA